MQPTTTTWTPPDRWKSTEEGITYGLLTDQQLVTERARLRVRLDDLTMSPGSSPAVSQILVNIEQEIERITDDLRRRAISRHRSTGMSILRSFQSMSWPSNVGKLGGY